MLEAIDPSKGTQLRTYPEMSDRETRAALERADRAFQAWRETGFPERSRRMHGAAAVLRRKAPDLAELMTREMGKPIRDARAEIEKCAAACLYFADHAEWMLEAQTARTDAAKSYWTYQPLGVVLAVMPWNFPFWQVFRFAAPTLMAGNAGVL